MRTFTMNRRFLHFLSSQNDVFLNYFNSENLSENRIDQCALSIQWPKIENKFQKPICLVKSPTKYVGFSQTNFEKTQIRKNWQKYEEVVRKCVCEREQLAMHFNSEMEIRLQSDIFKSAPFLNKVQLSLIYDYAVSHK